MSGAEPARPADAISDGPDPRDLRLDLRYGRVVRTPELPMAFSFEEFARGAWWAWLGFHILFSAAYTSMGVAASFAAFAAFAAPDPFGAFGASLAYVPAMLLASLLFALPWSVGALVLLGGPAAWVLGRALRRVRGRRWHLIAFTALGLGVGFAVSSIATTTMQPGWGLSPFVVIGSPATAVAVAYGWWRTASRALSDDTA